ncbi:hypothetical protein BC628DRAFT_914814 [Trametes gibbosa]|nr:hypothetical protein BC628DRAFT_914814 [Trametes gibbosa]
MKGMPSTKSGVRRQRPLRLAGRINPSTRMCSTAVLVSQFNSSFSNDISCRDGRTPACLTSLRTDQVVSSMDSPVQQCFLSVLLDARRKFALTLTLCLGFSLVVSTSASLVDRPIFDTQVPSIVYRRNHWARSAFKAPSRAATRTSRRMTLRGAQAARPMTRLLTQSPSSSHPEIDGPRAPTLAQSPRSWSSSYQCEIFVAGSVESCQRPQGDTTR